MKWFGEPWPSDELRAPVCEDDADKTDPPPPGIQCILCREPFEEGAQGVTLPHLSAEARRIVKAYIHLDCLLGNIGALP